jgi:hypothetical protein
MLQSPHQTIATTFCTRQDLDFKGGVGFCETLKFCNADHGLAAAAKSANVPCFFYTLREELMKRFATHATVISLLLTANCALAAEKKALLYVGTQNGVNAGVVTTHQSHLNGTTKIIGYSIDDASAQPAAKFVEIYVGNQAGVNDGVVSTSQNHMGGATESIGYLSKDAIAGGTKLYVGTQRNCNEGVVTTSIQHLNCSTSFVGYTLPQ